MQPGDVVCSISGLSEATTKEGPCGKTALLTFPTLLFMSKSMALF